MTKLITLLGVCVWPSKGREGVGHVCLNLNSGSAIFSIGPCTGYLTTDLKNSEVDLIRRAKLF